MRVFEAIKGRRSIRRFENRSIEKEVLLKLVEAGIWAPTGGNAQTWAFVIVTDQRRIQKIKAVSPGMLGTPSALIVVCQDRELAYEKGGEIGRDTLSIMDAAMASQNIMLQAYEEKLGSCAILSFHEKGVQTLLKLPGHIVPELVISLGYPAESPKPPQRKFEEVYFFEEY
ncbi:nitroreductase family protein [Candidatus Aerophobetes bacterium]|uniref:Nitroreductase family protein n=1 Tax=Aerophobetes bacterium TaxID=2030807 RepID=A0A523QG33_UNCAE|nr:MAG: nitroreductase family protein [Candidatus Aerophobetes bacterium]